LQNLVCGFCRSLSGTLGQGPAVTDLHRVPGREL
jgi:hypothetical protein